MRIQNLIQNGNFKSGTLDPWLGENTDVIGSPCPSIVDGFSARLKSGEEVANLFQNFNVITGETYQLVLSIATAGKGTSPPVKIRVEYLNRLLEVVGIGLDESIPKSQLPNGSEGKFNTIQLLTTVVPKEVRFARLIIEKQGLAFSPSVVIDNVFMSRITAELTPLPNTYVGNTGTDTTSIIFEDNFNTLTVGNTPNAMIRAFNGDTRLLYIAFGNEQYVSVIDVSTQEVLTTIPVSGVADFYYNRNIAVSPDASRVYMVTDQFGTGFVNIIDTCTNQLANVVTVGENPLALALTSDGSTLYVANGNSKSVSQLDTENLIIIETFDFLDDFGESISFLVLTSNEQQMIVGGFGPQGDLSCNGKFEVIDVVSSEVIFSITYGTDTNEIIYSMTLSSDGEFLYVGTADNDERTRKTFLNIFDTSTWDCIDIQLYSEFLSTGSGNYFIPYVIQEVSEGVGESLIYVSVVNSSQDVMNIYEISRCNNTFNTVTNVSIDGFTNGYFMLSSDASTITTANQSGNSVSYISTDTFSVASTITVGTCPEVLVVD
ncbi:NTTRR-F1 domain [Bacillus carboniphilus]|uniref:NTTRR-F1 domain n=1 Tax=Bacillus carboniphilus TaxID=86663 RepID=A0ABY9JV12_9BACI|nr:NTTRR-F1 domain [Bacillus carboniphilus]WLR43254.1 NTTRR-F1 domain [Bacillus carboniphilus]